MKHELEHFTSGRACGAGSDRRSALQHAVPAFAHAVATSTGAQVYIKFENLQFTASFKERGALNRLLSLDPIERQRGVCTMSAGNHGQAVAYHAHRLGIPATIVMPRHTPFVKVEHTRSHGAEVMAGTATPCSEAVRVRAAGHGQARQLVFVHPYDDAAVMAGQGTIGAGDAGRGAGARRAGGADRRRRADLHRGRRQGELSAGIEIIGVQTAKLSWVDAGGAQG